MNHGIGPVTGHGTADPGSRLEAHIQNFAQELGDGPALLGMMAGGLTYRATRLTALKGLFRPSLSHSLGQVWGRRSLAAALALGAESAAFTAALRASRKLSGQDSQVSWEREWGSAALTLGSLRFFGSAAALAGKGLNRAALSQAAMFTGILTAQRLEQELGLSPQQENSHPMSHALATLVHFNMAGAMAQRLTPKGLRNFEKNLEIQSELLLKKQLGSFQASLSHMFDLDPWAAQPALAMAGVPLSKGSDRVFNLGGGRDTGAVGGGLAKKVYTPEETKRLRDYYQRMSPGAQRALLQIQGNYGRDFTMMELLTELDYLAKPAWEVGLRRLGQLVGHAQRHSARGSYVAWITRQCLSEILAKRSPQKLQEILSVLERGSSLESYEKILATELAPAALDRSKPGSQLLQIEPRDANFQRIQKLPFNRAVRHALWQWARVRRDLQKIHQAFPSSVEQFIEAVERLATEQPENLEALERAIEVSVRSPLALFRFQRLALVLQQSQGSPELTRGKLRELGDRNFFLLAHQEAYFPDHSLHIRDSQFDAYLNDSKLGEFLFRFHEAQKDLLNPEAAASRHRMRHGKLEQFLEARRSKAPLEVAEVAQAFRQLGDLDSLKIAKAIEKGEFHLEVLDAETFQNRVKYGPGQNTNQSGKENAVYYYSGVLGPKGVMLVKRPALNLYSPETAPDALFEMLARIRHEYQHHLDIDPHQTRTPKAAFTQELRAYAQEQLWRGMWGDIRDLQNVPTEGALGFSLYHRDVFENLRWGQIWGGA